MWGLSGIKGKGTEYYHHDGHGNVTAVTDENGAVLKSYEYDAFGVELNEDAGDANPFRYCGAYYDKETGLYYLVNRYYDPTLGRFTQRDPAKDGSNWYIYCYNDPINLLDIRGLMPSELEAAYMEKHFYDYDVESSYNDRIVKDINGNSINWRLIDGMTDGSLKIGIYIKFDDEHDWKNPLEYAVVFKGTEITSVEDWENNAAQFLGEYSSHLLSGIKYVGKFVKNNDYEITFIGHSKGAGEAAVNAELWNRNAIVFNPSIPNITYALSDQGYVKSFVVTDEVLSYYLGELPLGTTQYLPRQYNSWLPGINIKDRINNHSMNAVISALIEGGFN